KTGAGVYPNGTRYSKKGREHLLQERGQVFQIIHSLRGRYALEKMCFYLKVSPSGYYKWSKHSPSPRQRRRDELIKDIKQIFERSKRSYGSRRVAAVLRQTQQPCSRPFVAILMQHHSLRSRLRPRFVRTTDSTHSYGVVENLLNRNF